MPRVSRRFVLGQSLVWAAGLGTARALKSSDGADQRGLDQFVTSPPCKDEKLTPVVAPRPAFAPDAPRRTSLVEPGAAGSRVVISGHVIGLKCGRIKGARVDFWHPDATGAYASSGKRFRGYQLTDAEGRYRLETIRPGTAMGRAPHVSVRVEPPGKPALTTVIFFPGDPANASDTSFVPALAMREVAGGAARTYAFDFILDL